MIIHCPSCGYHVYAPEGRELSEEELLSAAASIHNSRRKTHGSGHAGGRPRGYRKCPKCQKIHHPEGICKA